MTVLITLTTAGSLTGPFNLCTNIDGFVTPFETGVAKATLVAGYTCVLVPTGTTSIQVKSTGACIDVITLLITGVITTTAPTTTIVPCVRPSGLTNFSFTSGHTALGVTNVYANMTIAQICSSLQAYCFPNYGGMSESIVSGQSTFIMIGNTMYNASTTGCTYLPNGKYIVGQASQTCGNIATIITILNGIITEISTACTVTSTTTTVSPLPPGAALSIITQGYPTAQLACNNYTNNGGSIGGVGTAGQIYVSGNMAYNANGTPFVGNPALFYIITPYINITPGLESTCHISALGVVTGGANLDCLTVNIP